MAESVSVAIPAAIPPDKAPSLAALQELPLPDPVPYTPQTVGWWIIAAGMLIVLAFALWRWRQHLRANRYRVEALRELDDIEQALKENLQAATLLPALVKRVALVSAPRDAAAALSGDNWLQWLDRTLPQAGFLTASGQLLPVLAYTGPQAVDAQTLNALLILVRRWIRDHRVHP